MRFAAPDPEQLRALRSERIAEGRRRAEERRERRQETAKRMAAGVGRFVEDSIGNSLVRNADPGLLFSSEEKIPEPFVWYRVPLAEGMCGDGSDFHMYVKEGDSPHLCIFLSGGGVAWNAYTAGRPVTGAAVAAGEPNFYWNNLRPFTQIMNIQTGITEADSARNPFRDWNFAVIPYATGDFHFGNAALPYTDAEGEAQCLHFHGQKNVKTALETTRRFFPQADRLLVAGDSAGAFAVPGIAGKIAEVYYPECEDITLFSDSALLPNPEWRQIARDVWRAEPEIWRALTTDNLTLDLYRALEKKYPEKFRILYASSTHDYLLSMYMEDMENGEFRTDPEVEDRYFLLLKEMCGELRALTKRSGFFLTDWSNRLNTKGQPGTFHTSVRQPWFYRKTPEGISMAEWLRDAADGNMRDVGMELLTRG